MVLVDGGRVQSGNLTMRTNCRPGMYKVEEIGGGKRMKHFEVLAVLKHYV